MDRLAGGARSVKDAGGWAYGKGQQGLNMAKTHADNGNLFLFLAFFIAVVDYLGEGRYTGFEWVFGFENVDVLTQIVTSGVFGTIILIYVIFKLISGDLRPDPSFLIFAVVVSFFIINNYWFANIKATFHFVYILFFGLTFMMSYDGSSAVYRWISVFLILDFFGYGLLQFIPVLEYLPIILLFSSFYVYQKTQSRVSKFFLVAVVIVMFVFAYQEASAVGSDLPFAPRDVGPSFKDLFGDFKQGAENIVSSWQKTLEGRIQYAITGKVEENEFEPLGVYLENVQSADPRYYEDEDIVVWGTITARTLDDPINIQVGCFAGDRKDGKVADKVDPENKFTVFTLEDNDFACTFGGCPEKESPCETPCNPQEPGCQTVAEREILKTGSNTITTFADFNFETLAFLKVYFMNRERQRAMVRQGLDPFEEFAITDKSPVAVYTNGPAKIEMGTNNPLVAVSKDYIVEPSLDIKIDNREGWQGEIKRLKELVLFLPDGIDFEPQQSCGSMKFLDYNLSVCGEEGEFGSNNCCTREEMENNKCMACTQSCQDFVVDECREVCSGFENADEIDRCNSDCNERGDICRQSCASFFAEGGQLYNGYALDTSDIKYRNEEDDFEKGKLFRCRFRPTEDVLGASPFTTKSFRVKARYDYSLEQDVSVEIVELPKELKASEPAIQIDEETSKILESIEEKYGVYVIPKENEDYYIHTRDITITAEGETIVNADKVQAKNADINPENAKIIENALQEVPFVGSAVQIIAYYPEGISSIYEGKFWRKDIGSQPFTTFNVPIDEKSFIVIGFLDVGTIVHEIGHAIDDAVNEKYYQGDIDLYRQKFFNHVLHTDPNSPIIKTFAEVTSWGYDENAQNFVTDEERRMNSIVEDFAESFAVFYTDPSQIEGGEKKFFENLDKGLRADAESFFQQVADNPDVLLDGTSIE